MRLEDDMRFFEILMGRSHKVHVSETHGCIFALEMVHNVCAVQHKATGSQDQMLLYHNSLYIYIHRHISEAQNIFL